jgi:hypothetical protein
MVLFQLVQLLAQRLWARVAPRKRQTIQLPVGDQSLSDVGLLRISKPGNVILTGRLGGRRVKVYQTFGAAQADLIERACALPKVRENFPRVLHRDGCYVVAEWIEGKPLTVASLVTRPGLLERFVDLQAALHGQQLAVREPGFDYVAFLLARLHRFRGILPLSDGLKWLLDEVQSAPDLPPPRLSHPDFTPANVVVERDSGRLKVIDNEALTQSSAYLMDLFVTCHSLRNPAGLAERYVALQRERVGDLQLAGGVAAYLLALWGLRLVGAMFQAGQFAQAYRLAERMAAGEFDGHPVVGVIREREKV